jgi:uncharacterized protein (UPF0218 family)
MYQQYEYIDMHVYIMSLQKVESVTGEGESKKQQNQTKLIYGDHSCASIFVPKTPKPRISAVDTKMKKKRNNETRKCQKKQDIKIEEKPNVLV